ncbi:MAG: hypothetical protein H7256_04345 [Bdellovibrio sp.]|nr:hypothetical protein [Bdellovibrio sp.]
MPKRFKSGAIKIDFAFIQTSAPDKNGYVSLGTSVDIAKSAVLAAGCVIAEINQQMPRTFGDGLLSVSQLHFAVESNHPLFTSHEVSVTEDEKKIGQYVAQLIDDGSCLQAGIGSIPNAVMAALKDHRHLGVGLFLFKNFCQ